MNRPQGRQINPSEQPGASLSVVGLRWRPIESPRGGTGNMLGEQLGCQLGKKPLTSALKNHPANLGLSRGDEAEHVRAIDKSRANGLGAWNWRAATMNLVNPHIIVKATKTFGLVRNRKRLSSRDTMTSQSKNSTDDRDRRARIVDAVKGVQELLLITELLEDCARALLDELQIGHAIHKHSTA